MFDFDHTLDHRKDNSYRWNESGMKDGDIGMGTADLDFNSAPCIKEALLKVANENCYNYRIKSDEYYNALISWYKRNYDLDIKKEWVSNVPSTIGAIRIAIALFASKGESVIVQTPLFSPLRWAIEGAGCKVIENEMKSINGHFEIDFEDFEKKIKEEKPKAFVLVNPHNPTGRVFTKEELERLVDICYEHGVKIISDEVHCLIIYGENKFIPLLKVSEKAKEIGVQIVSLSKGYNIMSLPHAIITIANLEMQNLYMEQLKAFSFGYATNSFSIAAVTSILKGEADSWMKELRAYLENNLDTILSFFEKENLPLVAYRPEGGFLLYVDCSKAGIGDTDLDLFFLEKAHIHLDDGEKNFGSASKGFVRINFALTKENIEIALDRIKNAFK